MAYQQYSGDVKQYLGRDLIAPQFQPLGEALGERDLPGGKEFASGGTVYKVEDTGTGGRRIVAVGSESQILGDQELARQKAERAALLAKQEGEEKGLIDEFQTKVQQAPSLETTYQTLGQELGIPQIRDITKKGGEAVQNLYATLSDLPDHVKRLKTGFDVNADRLKRIVESRSEPIRRDLADMSRQYGIDLGNLASLEQELGRRLGFAREDFQNKVVQPLLFKAGLISERIAREMSSFNTESQNKLTFLLDEIQGGRQLTLKQMELANNLALKEEEYQNEKQKQKSFITVDGRIKLVDNFTAQVIADLGSSTAPKDKSSSSMSDLFSSGSGWKISTPTSSQQSGLDSGAISLDTLYNQFND